MTRVALALICLLHASPAFSQNEQKNRPNRQTPTPSQQCAALLRVMNNYSFTPEYRLAALERARNIGCLQ